MSDKALRITVAVISAVGVLVAAYLTYVHYHSEALVCTASGGCETVQKSEYAVLFGVPVAAYGFIGDAAILITALLTTSWARFAGFFIALMGFLFTLYLKYLELFVIHAICLWCVAHAVLVLLLLIFTTMRFVRDY